MAPGAMPWVHRYIGSPVLSMLVNLFFGTRIGDVNCGMRAFTRDAYHRLALKTAGMEFASEMVARAARIKPKGRKLRTASISTVIRDINCPVSESS